MSFAQFQFLRPYFLWLLPLLLVIYFVQKRKGVVSSSWEKVCDAPLLKYLLTDTQNGTRKWQAFWLWLGLISAVLALSGVSFEERLDCSLR